MAGVQGRPILSPTAWYLPSSGWWSRRGARDCSSWCKLWARAEEEQLPIDAQFACGRSLPNCRQRRAGSNTLEKPIQAAHRANPASNRDAVPGFGLIVSSAVVATMNDRPQGL
jgi:hypothetical protein